MGFRAACADSGSKVLSDAIRDEKLSILRPSIAALSQPDLIVAERFSVGFRGILFMWRTVADVAVQDEEGRGARRLAKHLQGLLDSINVVRVADPQNVPTVTQKAGRDVLREGDSRIPFDGDVVVVVDPAEMVQAKSPRQECRFRSDPLHHATVPANGIDVVVENTEARLVVAAGKPLLVD